METYTWHDDDTGQRMVDLLVAKKQQGVDVKVIYDSLGQNSDSPDRPKKMLTQLAAAGIEAIEYNRDVSGPTGVNLTHRKLVIVDGESALLGGMNVGDNYSKYWHDSMVRVDGPAVADIVREYAFDWQQAGGSGAMLSLPASPKPLNGDSEVAVLVTSPRQPEKARQIHTGLMAAYDAARKEIWIENPYFSDPVMVAHLQAAQRRGVQVNVILPRGNDEPLFTQLNAIAAHDLVADGARTWLIDTGPNNLNFNHTKMSMVDGQWVMMGSSNADPRTYEDNQECNVAITDRSVCDDVKQRLIDVDLTKSLPYQPPDLPPNASLLRLAASFL